MAQNSLARDLRAPVMPGLIASLCQVLHQKATSILRGVAGGVSTQNDYAISPLLCQHTREGHQSVSGQSNRQPSIHLHDVSYLTSMRLLKFVLTPGSTLQTLLQGPPVTNELLKTAVESVIISAFVCPSAPSDHAASLVSVSLT